MISEINFEPKGVGVGEVCVWGGGGTHHNGLCTDNIVSLVNTVESQVKGLNYSSGVRNPIRFSV